MRRGPTLPGRPPAERPRTTALRAGPAPHSSHRRRLLTAAALVLALVASALGAAACGGSSSRDDAVKLHVLAAASLTEAFTRLGADFEAAHPGTAVVFDFAGSQDLVAQIGQGAPADVLATADTASMDAVAGDAAAPQIFATNQLEIVVAPGNPEGVTGLESLARPELKVVLAAPEVPAGKYAQAVLARAGVTVKPVSLEESVKGVVTKIALGEADAGIVYVTDVRAAAGEVAGVAIPTDANVTADYPIATLEESGASAQAQAFVDYVLSPAGQQTLQGFGFGPPPS
jgi:molybdate transport system substrate-binding protein